jgi:hypothetical protein
MNAPVRPPIHPNPALYYSPEMVAELAMGMDPPYDIAARYGLTRQEFDQLQAQAWFGEMVARKRQELSDDGILFSSKAAMMAEELWARLFQAACANQLAHPLVVETAKQLTEIGQLKPKAAANVGGGGPAFQINIQVNGVDAGQAKARGVSAEVVEAAPVISIPLEPGLPPKPAGLKVPDFDLRVGALTGSTTAVAAAQAPLAMPPQPR